MIATSYERVLAQPVARLPLHTWSEEPRGVPVREIVEWYGVADRTTFTPGTSDFDLVDDAALADICRSFDVFVLPTMGEGFAMTLAASGGRLPRPCGDRRKYFGAVCPTLYLRKQRERPSLMGLLVHCPIRWRSRYRIPGPLP